MSNAEQPVSERIKFLLEKLASGNKAELGRAAGISGQAIADLIGGKKGGPSFPVLQKILRSYPEVSERWLIFGEGEMQKPASGEDAGTNNSAVSATAKTVGIDPRLLTGDTSQVKKGTFNYPSPPSTQPAKVNPKEVLGNLVEQLDRNTSDIEELRTALTKIQQQLKS